MKQIAEHGDFEIYQTSSLEPDFYCGMGRYFADKQIVKELEGPMFNDDSYVWLIAKLDNQVVGFSSCRFDEKGAHFGITYIIPDYRRKGLYRSMFLLKQELCVGRDVRVISGLANPVSKAVFDANGWTVSRQAGKWTYYKKEVA